MGQAFAVQCQQKRDQLDSFLTQFFLCGCCTIIIGPLLFVPLSWGNPFDGENEGGCENPEIISATLAVPCLILAGVACMGCGACIAAMLGGVVEAGAGASCVLGVSTPLSLCTLAAPFLMAPILLMALGSADCVGDSHTFVLSVNLMLILGVMLGLMFCVCINFVRFTSACRCLLGLCRGHRHASQARPAPAEPAAAAPAPRIPRVYTLLRDACALGDSFLVSLLLDLDGHREQLCWRAWRCLLLCCCLGQCRPSRHSQTEQKHGRVSRASVAFAFEDDDSSTAVHYIALGTWHSREGGPRQHGLFRLWPGNTSGLWPQLTDRRRARLFARLVDSGWIEPAMLSAQNGKGRTPLHCAASTGSIETVRTIDKYLRSSGTVEDGSCLRLADANWDTPLDLALKAGKLDMACLLLSLGAEREHWVGLTRREQHRGQVRSSLDVLAQPSRGGRSVSPSVGSPQRLEQVQAVLADSQAVLEHMNLQVRELQRQVGSPLPLEAAQALLRYHNFDIAVAARAFAEGPRAALDAAGLADVPAPVAPGPQSGAQAASPVRTRAGSMCIVCMEPAPAGGLLACSHVCCEVCLTGHIRARVEEGDVNGLVCPWPDCKCAVSDSLVVELFDPQRIEGTTSGITVASEEHRGDGEVIIVRLRALRAQAFVNSKQNLSWCPRPGCGHAVAVTSTAGDGGAERLSLSTLECACGMRFCGPCNQEGGHEPANCKQWKDWQEQEAKDSKEETSATARWLVENTQKCPKCSANINRNGGCNHMTCKSCGKHFCYVCGGDWEQHKQQAGGFDFYRCRMGDRETREDKVTAGSAPGSFGACRDGFRANVRDAKWEKGVLGLAISLAEVFGIDQGYQEFLTESLSATLAARELLKFCYVLKHTIGEDNRNSWHWLYQVAPCISELEVVASKLESVAGLSFLAASARAVGLERPSNLATPERQLLQLDLREALAHAAAVAEVAGFAQQLTMAVRLQTQHLLSVGRAWQELTDEERRGGVFESVPAAARRPMAQATRGLVDGATDIGNMLWSLGCYVGSFSGRR
mmetsp:Transcript_79659/g.257596  ORF Transcript_79659/g.257596 Transcript_79659/m.257596 type:complete len:1041 (-) Transcript_79659:255-3377(-)